MAKEILEEDEWQDIDWVSRYKNPWGYSELCVHTQCPRSFIYYGWMNGEWTPSDCEIQLPIEQVEIGSEIPYHGTVMGLTGK